MRNLSITVDVFVEPDSTIEIHESRLPRDREGCLSIRSPERRFGGLTLYASHADLRRLAVVIVAYLARDQGPGPAIDVDDLLGSMASNY